MFFFRIRSLENTDFPRIPRIPRKSWEKQYLLPAAPTRRRAATVGSEITTRTIRSRLHRRLVSGAGFRSLPESSFSQDFLGILGIPGKPKPAWQSSKKCELGSSSFFPEGRVPEPVGFGRAGSREAFHDVAPLAGVGKFFPGFEGFPGNSWEIIVLHHPRFPSTASAKIETEECRNETSKTSALFCTKNH